MMQSLLQLVPPCKISSLERCQRETCISCSNLKAAPPDSRMKSFARAEWCQRNHLHRTAICRIEDMATTAKESMEKQLTDPSPWVDDRFTKTKPWPPASFNVELSWIEYWFNPCWRETEPALLVGVADSCLAVQGENRQGFGLNDKGPDRDSTRFPLSTRVSKNSGSHDCSGGLTGLKEDEPLKEALQNVDVDTDKLYISTNKLYFFLQTCMQKRDLAAGREVHHLIMRSGYESDNFVANHLIRMFALCGSLCEASRVFMKLSNPDVFTWSSIISAHANLGYDQQAIKLYFQMQESGANPDGQVFVAVLKACTTAAALPQGKLVHVHIIGHGLQSNKFVCNTLVNMYAKCGSLDAARREFDKLLKRDIVTWGAMIAGYAQHGQSLEAFQLFHQMQQDGMVPDQALFINILKACYNMDQGKLIHVDITENGLESNEFVGGALVDMYTKCGQIEEASRVFKRLPHRDAVTWNALITGYAQNGCGQDTFELFRQMQQDGMEPTYATFVSVLNACSTTGALDEGKLLHAQIIKQGFGLDSYIGNALIDMYTKCRSLDDGCRTFNRLLKRDVVTWTAMIAGYVKHGYGNEAIQLFEQMKQGGIEPNQVTFVIILRACSSIAALDQGKLIYARIIECGFELDILVGSILIDMYAKCGSLDDAEIVFNRWPKRDVVTWTAMLAGYGQHGHSQKAFHLFQQMLTTGTKPDSTAFLCLLSVCSHVGLVKAGCHNLRLMREVHGIVPMLEHYNCMVDVFGRAGQLNEAEDLLEIMPFRFNFVGWISFLCHCRTHSSVEQGRRSFDYIVTMDCKNSAGYTLMSNIFAHVDMWEDVQTIEEMRKIANAWKKPGRAFIEIEDKVHHFIVGGKSHPQSGKIYGKLKSLSLQMKEEGYMPSVDVVMQSMSDDDKEDLLCGHCEKLAIAFGLITTAPGSTIRVSKNLRMCKDCHNATKIISKIERREIIITDTYRSHHFKGGSCSCYDFY